MKLYPEVSKAMRCIRNGAAYDHEAKTGHRVTIGLFQAVCPRCRFEAITYPLGGGKVRLEVFDEDDSSPCVGASVASRMGRY